jgi:hypothetical protein
MFHTRDWIIFRLLSSEERRVCKTSWTSDRDAIDAHNVPSITKKISTGDEVCAQNLVWVSVSPQTQHTQTSTAIAATPQGEPCSLPRFWSTQHAVDIPQWNYPSVLIQAQGILDLCTSSTVTTNFTQHTWPIIVASQCQEGNFGICNAKRCKVSHLLHNTCKFVQL